METARAPANADDEDVIIALRGLAQEIRLEVLALLVANGPEGMSAGEIGAHIDVSAAALSFHFQQLLQAGLVTRRRRSRQIIYAPNRPRMRWLLARLHEQWDAPQPGERRAQTVPMELAEDELELVAGGMNGGGGRCYLNMPLILEILDSSNRIMSPA